MPTCAPSRSGVKPRVWLTAAAPAGRLKAAGSNGTEGVFGVDGGGFWGGAPSNVNSVTSVCLCIHPKPHSKRLLADRELRYFFAAAATHKLVIKIYDYFENVPQANCS